MCVRPGVLRIQRDQIALFAKTAMGKPGILSPSKRNEDCKMKYTNTYNGHTYWIEGEKVMVSNGEIVHTSNMDIPTFKAMIFNGDMVAIEVDKENFRKLVNVAKAANPEFQIRYLAFVEHMGKEAFVGNVIKRNQAYMSWIDARKKQYCEMRRHMIQIDHNTGHHIILDHLDFTDFIVSGEWL